MKKRFEWHKGCSFPPFVWYNCKNMNDNQMLICNDMLLCPKEVLKTEHTRDMLAAHWLLVCDAM